MDGGDASLGQLVDHLFEMLVNGRGLDEKTWLVEIVSEMTEACSDQIYRVNWGS
jgi:hypothetical protein